MDIGKSITYLLEDPEWASKALLAALISNVPFLNIAWIGYLVETTRNVQSHDPFPLPDWSELGQKFISGLLLLLASLIYSLPVFIFILVPLGGIFLGFLPGEGDIQEYAATGFGIVVLILSCCVMAYMILLTFYLPGVIIYFAREGTFQSCFKIRQIFDIIFGNIGDYLTAIVVAAVASLAVGLIVSVISVLFVWIVCIGWILLFIVGAVANVWIGTIFAHLLGQVSSGYSTTTVPTN